MFRDFCFVLFFSKEVSTYIIFALCTAVTWLLWLFLAYSKANSAMRLLASSVINLMLCTTPSTIWKTGNASVVQVHSSHLEPKQQNSEWGRMPFTIEEVFMGAKGKELHWSPEKWAELAVLQHKGSRRQQLRHPPRAQCRCTRPRCSRGWWRCSRLCRAFCSPRWTRMDARWRKGQRFYAAADSLTGALQQLGSSEALQKKNIHKDEQENKPFHGSESWNSRSSGTPTKDLQIPV